MRLGEIGITRQRLFIRGDCLVLTTKGVQRRGEIGMGLGGLRPQNDRLPGQFQALLGPATLEMERAEIEQRANSSGSSARIAK